MSRNISTAQNSEGRVLTQKGEGVTILFLQKYEKKNNNKKPKTEQQQNQQEK